MGRAMLTTIDNPYNPFTEYQEWYAWDERQGYHTPGMLARIAVVSDEMSEADQAASIEAAIDEIVYENVIGVYRKVIQEGS
jgi:hypothetical protein